jgi:hypothetical protein
LRILGDAEEWGIKASSKSSAALRRRCQWVRDVEAERHALVTNTLVHLLNRLLAWITRFTFPRPLQQDSTLAAPLTSHLPSGQPRVLPFHSIHSPTQPLPPIPTFYPQPPPPPECSNNKPVNALRNLVRPKQAQGLPPRRCLGVEIRLLCQRCHACAVPRGCAGVVPGRVLKGED